MSEFVARHIGLNESSIAEMLTAVGAESVDDLISATLPESIAISDGLNLAAGLSEPEILARLRQLANQNKLVQNHIGQGYYGTILPSVIARNLLENPGWYTSYTPYQPEISQGRLESLLNFQTVITDLTGLNIAGASLLDESTAAAEAMTLMHRASKNDSNMLLVDADTHPQTLAVLRTRALPIGIELRVQPSNEMDFTDSFGVILSNPGTSGRVSDLSQIIDTAHSAGNLVAVATDLLASILIKSAGEMGADLAFGSAQRFGVPLGFGGPHAGFLAVRTGFERNLPGRLVGVSRDVHGKLAYRLALQTREQHIRREKATSNICTAQALLANIAAMYAIYHGYEGLFAIASRVHGFATRFAAAAGLNSKDAFFDTVEIEVPNAEAKYAALLKNGIEVRLVSTSRISVAFDETTTESDFQNLVSGFGFIAPSESPSVLSGLARTAAVLQADVFKLYRTETEMMRYLRRLMDKDIALDRSMIPLGSCTMKLNSATEMAAISWPEFANIHPYTDPRNAEGWTELIAEISADLIEITGYDAVSLQPNAGSQGEFAGLLAIANYHAERNEPHRRICLIPSSAHGTNAASAVMAGMQVVVVACDELGYIDLEDLKQKIQLHQANLAAIMVTYPSTHGVFEENITEICELIHAAGGQVYVDGANLNALVGIAKPGKFGADVSHLNLHKTFAIPHGGGGPGIGPVAVKAHLAKYLPGDPLDPASTSAVSGANFGSAGVLPIAYAYIKLMGAEGLQAATQTAILSANYLAKKLDPYFPVLYTNHNGYVAHECILDFREITKNSGVTVDDVAKRLMDFGFHAPTMSFPVAGTLMIEPTESESKLELDRFIAAMKEIHAEIQEIMQNKIALEDSWLRNAPHTASALIAKADAEYGARAAYSGGVKADIKYWPPVGRIDGAYGDRNLVCTCMPLSDYEN